MKVTTEEVTTHKHSIEFEDRSELEHLQKNLSYLLSLADDPANFPTARRLELQLRQRMAIDAGDDYLPQHPVARFPGKKWVTE